MNNQRDYRKNVGIRVYWFCVGLLLCLCFLTVPVSAQGSNDSSASSVDAVILMDHSKSMDYNDESSHRIDAAQMFISLCDMNSRVAFVPFSGSVMEGADTAFTDISNQSLRDDKLDEIEKYRLVNFISDYRLKPYKTLKDTDYGQALNYAVKLIMDRTDTTNDPMIILLTDGKNDFNNDLENFTVTEWDDAIKSFVENKYRKYTAADADLLCKDAVLCAIENEIPVFTLAIPDTLSKNSEQYALEHELEQISIDTGVGETFTTLSANNVAELPQYFGNMLASRIGSNLIHNLNPIPVDGEQGKYRIILPILNSSVYEANIYIPTDHIDANSIRLYSPNTALGDLSGGGKDVIMFDCKEFRLYKIIQPRTLGKWTLEFVVDKASYLPENITFSILYNYNITLKTQIGQEFNGLQNVDEGITLAKGETLRISSSFYDTDGTPTNDPNLYAEWSGDAWQTIRGTYEFYNDGGAMLFSGDLINGVSSFDGSIDLSTAYPDVEGYNALTEGEYTLRIIADGAGLHRENELKVTLTNTLPKAANGSSAQALTYRYSVDDSSDPATLEIQTLEVVLSDKIIDPDNDKLYFSLAPVSNTNVFPLKLKGSTIEGQTVQDPDTGLFLYGKSQYTLTVSDSRIRNGVTWDVSVNVVSVMQQMMERFYCDTQVSGYDINSMSIPKCSSVTFTMSLMDTTTGAVDTTGMISSYNGKLLVYNAIDTSVLLDSLTMEADGKGQISCTYTPSSYAQTLSFRCEYTMNNFSQTVADTDLLTLRIINTAPKVNVEASQAIPKEIKYNAAVPLILWVDRPTSDDDLVISLSKLFSDTDLCDSLSYSYPSTNENSPLELLFDEEATLTLVPQHSGTFELIITAQDLDHETATVSLSVKVTDLAVKWRRLTIITGISLLALILLGITVYQIQKPYFSYKTKLAVYETGAVVESEIRDLLHTKKALLLSNLIDVTIAERNGVSAKMLTSVQLKPLRAYDGSVQVHLKSSTSGFAIKLGEDEIGRKYVQWSIGGELTIQSMSTKAYIRIVLTMDMDSMSTSGGKADIFNNLDDDGMMENAGDFGGFNNVGTADENENDPDFDDNDFNNPTF